MDTLDSSLLQPDTKFDWIGSGDSRFDDFLPIVSVAKNASDRTRAIFSVNTVGINTARDEWVYGESADSVKKKVQAFLNSYVRDLESSGYTDEIKWSEAQKTKKNARKLESFSTQNFRSVLYRPFTRQVLYESSLMIDRFSYTSQVFPTVSLLQLFRHR